ncbi:putative amidase-like protein [Streptomyces sp. 846.5]|nr:amidase domain-containing protein [Streptomyces sp. 846.5]TDT95374.1 putative amidase-like protein [Streptomyces sp. 846.5]
MRWQRVVSAGTALLLGAVLVPLSSSTAAAVSCGSTPEFGPVRPTNLQVAGLATGAPVLSGIVSSDLGTGLVTGNIFLTDSTGAAVGGTPTATGTVPSGSRVSWQVPSGALTAGASYNWKMTSPRGCVQETTLGTGFTVPGGSGGTGSGSTGPSSVTLSGASLVAQTAIAGGSGAVAGGAFSVGGDGTNQWVSSLKADLSSIPTGSSINSATLNLTPAACLGSCSADSLTITQATSDVAAASTGSALSSVGGGMSFTASETASADDISTLVGAWFAGDVPNDGLLLTGSASAASGERYSGASLTVNYTPPTAATAPQTLTLTPGDGGVIAGWAEPSSTGYIDASAGTDGITSYTATATDPSGKVVATATTTDTSAVLSGLNDATSYLVSVTATNPVGVSPAVTGSATPEAVPGGKQQYIDAVSQFLNARNALQMGAATTASAATAADTQKAAITTWLGNEASADTAVAAYATSNGQQDTNDVTTLTNVLAALDPTGSTVNVYATANESFTTVDTSTGTAQSIPGSETDPVEYSFSVGSSPVVTNFTDASAVVVPVSAKTSSTAYSAALDAPAPTAPAPLTVDSTGDHFAAVPSGTVQPMYHYGNLNGIVNWANNNWNGTSNGFGDDCTDFASRAMHYGGGMPENVAPAPILQYTNDAYWFQYTYWYGLTKTSYSWAGAWHLSDYQYHQGAWFVPYVSWAAAGDLIWPNWSGGGWTGISHTGIVAYNSGSNLYIDQHTNNRYHEPLWKVAGQQTWQGSNPHLSLWVAQPYEKN